MKKFFATAVAASMLAAVPAGIVSADDDDAPEAPSVYDIAKDASKGRWIFDRNGDDFDILVLAVRVTGLKGALDDPNADLTVFAPNDKTFKDTFGGRSEFGTLIRVLRAVNYDRGALRDILLYHVSGANTLPGVDTDGLKGASFADVAALAGGGQAAVPMLAGGTTTVDTSAFVAGTGPVTLDGGSSEPSTIDAVDVGLGVASNGVIHVLGGSVLLP